MTRSRDDILKTRAALSPACGGFNIDNSKVRRSRETSWLRPHQLALDRSTDEPVSLSPTNLTAALRARLADGPQGFREELPRTNIVDYTSPEVVDDDGASTEKMAVAQPRSNLRRELTFSLLPKTKPFDPPRWESRHHVDISMHNPHLHEFHRDYFDCPQVLIFFLTFLGQAVLAIPHFIFPFCYNRS